MAAIIKHTLGSIPGINTTIHHAMAGIHITTAIISVVVTHPEAIIEDIIEVITREDDAGGGLMDAIVESLETGSVPTMREAFRASRVSFPHDDFSCHALPGFVDSVTCRFASRARPLSNHASSGTA